MKNNNKSRIKILQIIPILLVLVALVTNIQIFILGKNNLEIANVSIEEIKEETKNKEDNISEKIDLASTFNREIVSTTRYGIDRTDKIVVNVQEENEKFISIENIKISKDMDLTIRCGISKEDFKILMGNLKSDTSKFFYNNSDTIYELCKEYELNEIFFCGLIVAESGWNIASNHRNANNYISMMSNGRLIKYESTEEGLKAATKLLHNKYLTEGGSCYYGKTLSCVQKRFCPDSSTWVNLVYNCMEQIIKK